MAVQKVQTRKMRQTGDLKLKRAREPGGRSKDLEETVLSECMGPNIARPYSGCKRLFGRFLFRFGALKLGGGLLLW